MVQDNRYGTWNAWQNQYWPAEYLIDSNGQVRHAQFGEGDYKQDEAAVRQLLSDAGAHRLPPPMTATAVMPSKSLGTPETYLDDQRSQGFAEKLRPGVSLYAGTTNPALNQFALNGTFKVTNQSSTPVSDGASIIGRVKAAHVYLVLTSAGDIPRKVRVLLDGKPISDKQSGTDVSHGLVTVRGQRLYSLVSLPDDQQHLLTRAGAPGGQRVRLHVRVDGADRARQVSSIAAAWSRSSGVLTLNSRSGSETSSVAGLIAAMHSRSGRSEAEPVRSSSSSAPG